MEPKDVPVVEGTFDVIFASESTQANCRIVFPAA
jgi:hypothetical protein